MIKAKQKRILVTGGAGFIGTNLCQSLLAQNHYVFCLDNFYTSAIANLKPFEHSTHFELIEQDVCDPIQIKVDEIYHLACPASPVHYQRDPIYTAKTNFLGALNVLKCAQASQARVLLASTSEVYGNPLVHPQTESYLGHVNCNGIRACYDEGKRISETLFMDSMRQYNLNICIARIFNTYGPHMQPNDGRVISNFIIQALKQEPITLYGDGTQTRSFCYVGDLINGLQKLMQHTATGPYNLGNPFELTIREISSIILKLTDSQSTLTYKSLPDDDPIQRKPDIHKAQQDLNWEPVISLEEGLNHSISYFKKLLYSTSKSLAVN